MGPTTKAFFLLLTLAGSVACESNCERAIRQFLAESCRRDATAGPPGASKNCPGHVDYELIRLKGVITCESGERWGS
jgi:hypothetical protein